MQIKSTTLTITILIIVLTACGSERKNPSQAGENASIETPAPNQSGYLIYKTRGDYFYLVPILLTADKLDVSYYPDASDLKRGTDFCYPLKLADEYLLDRFGIGTNTAFLSWDYEKYFTSASGLSKSDMIKLVLDADPFLELYSCFTRVHESAAIEHFNDLITTGSISEYCTRLK